MSIPRMLHQIWYQGSDKVPAKYCRYRASWQRYHPDWECRLWDAPALRKHIAQHLPQFLPIYDAFPYDIQRMDSARYCLLAALGGVYADMDIECLRPIDELLAGRELILSETQGYNNAFIGSAPDHTLWTKVFSYLHESITSSADDVPTGLRDTMPIQIAVTVGPRFFTMCVKHSGVLELVGTLCCPGYYFEADAMSSRTVEDRPPYGRHNMDLNWMPSSSRLLSRLTRRLFSTLGRMRHRWRLP
ncbi:glycosyltransferase (plasmid) [Candidatus Fukatsuia symbiotica]|uniref:Glycosyl transferase n=1 Tax=Candidatus Fukatsuia symbiotica TaxID=1878942 RepID=A0A2U8I8L5_9GAMM|nr:glycosyltransferase [Candidatus Fukatsuia symbiotica]AWK15522.1 hypothetical protein CCS41_13915 [Candidatus Fukatsuia symbiotica]MEA9445910.1 glycosyltransferase [Candidatus Fukatsuia symbiotica]